MKKTTFIILFLITFLSNTQEVKAQFFKKLGKKVQDAAERTVQRKSEQKTDKEVSKSFDSVFNSGEKRKAKRRKKNQNKNGKVSDDNTNNTNSSSQNKNANQRQVKTSKDFVSGIKAIYTDTFKNDAIGDFPVTWNTNSSGEVVTFNNDNTRWLQLDSGGQYTPDGITKIPDNCTFEFDLTVTEKFNFYSDGLWINIVSVNDRRKDFTKWSKFGRDKNGVRFRIKPRNFEYTGESAITTYVNGENIISNKKNNKQFTLKNKTVHVAMWRQKKRLRIYLNDKKIWDLPRAFDTANYNSITFNTVGEKNEHFYVSNLRLAVAGKDTRHALLETGKFETNEILFDVNKANIKPSSYKILDDLGKVLQDNPNVNIKIIGHTDSDGSSQANLVLSKKRAEAIKMYLSNNFPIAGKRMQTIGKGESEPIVSNTTQNGKAKNRRVEFIKL